jgi:hypothetical protein
MAYQMRVAGMSWRDVCRECGYSRQPNAVAAARTYAQRCGLDWPIRIDALGRGARRYNHGGPPAAYEAAARAGLDAEVALTLGYADVRAAMRAAYRHAHRKGLPWPPDLRGDP